MSSSFSVVKPSYLENTSNIVVNGNLTVNGTVSTYVDTSLNSLPENSWYTIGNFPVNGGLYQGGVLAPNGFIYMLPGLSKNVLKIDPVTDSITIIATIPIPGNLFIAFGGVVAQNGKIYCAPEDVSFVLIIDTITDTVDYTSITGITTCIGAVVAPNGLIVMIKRNNGFHIINPQTNTYISLTVPGVPSSELNFSGGVLAPNGKIYAIPRDYTRVVVLDPVTLVVTTPAGLNGITSYICRCGALASNGKIYGFPTNGAKLLVINPSNDTFVEVAIAGLLGDSSRGGVLAPNGKLYSSPRDQNFTCIIDPVTNTVDYTTIKGFALPGIGGMFSGSVVAPNGNIYCVPHNYPKILVIRTGLPTQPNWMLKPYFNKL
jgi:hypothetical protein